MEEALHGYMEKIEMLGNNNEFLNKTYHHHLECVNKTLADFESIDAIPYFYPFSIEFNIIMASVWYIIWTNVEYDRSDSDLNDSQDKSFIDDSREEYDVIFKSNVSFNADCHSANLGMFAGLLSFLLIIITAIIFFATIEHSRYKTTGARIYSLQISFLTICGLIAITLALRKIKLLNIIDHSSSSHRSMDDSLLIIPLPFYFSHHFMCIYSDLINSDPNNLIMAACNIIDLLQIVLQTLFILDGVRRFSNTIELCSKKPGKQLITFLIIINVTLWILVTFELKSADKHHSMSTTYGHFVWMIIQNTCLPLMLFYRFHSSVCLSEMWKHCYEKD